MGTDHKAYAYTACSMLLQCSIQLHMSVRSLDRTHLERSCRLHLDEMVPPPLCYLTLQNTTAQEYGVLLCIPVHDRGLWSQSCVKIQFSECPQGLRHQHCDHWFLRLIYVTSLSRMSRTVEGPFSRGFRRVQLEMDGQVTDHI